MAFGSSIRAVLDLDYSKFASNASAAVSTFGKTLSKGLEHTVERSFGVKHLMKGLLMGMGMGGIEQIKDLIVGPFERAAEEAKRIQEVTAAGLASEQGVYSAKGGLTKKLELGKQNFKDLTREIEITKRTIAEFESNPLRFTNPGEMALLSQQKDILAGLMQQYQQIGSENDLMKYELKEQNAELSRQHATANEIAMVRRGQLTEERAALQELERLQIKAESHKNNPELQRKDNLEVKKQEEAIYKVHQDMQELNRQEAAGQDTLKIRLGQMDELTAAYRELDRLKSKSVLADAPNSILGRRAAMDVTKQLEAIQALKMQYAEAGRAREQLLDVGRVRRGEMTEGQAMAAERLRAQQKLGQYAPNSLEAKKVQNEILEIEQRQLALADRRRATVESIQQIERNVAAIGETAGENVSRLYGEANIELAKAHDLTRSLEEREQARLKYAEAIAEAGKAEYEWKNKTLSLQDASVTPSGRRNTTAQGIRARMAQQYDKRALAARQMGNYDEAARLGGIARNYTESFEQADRAGMRHAAGGTDPVFNSMASSLKAIESSLTVVEGS